MQIKIHERLESFHTRDTKGMEKEIAAKSYPLLHLSCNTTIETSRACVSNYERNSQLEKNK